ncbi:MAG: RHS repeat-associated core domain-containing protein, partial [Prosthecobacter sp.]|uniref:RHS repeat domain-containing protein n=1 Tax=Prosthecobacter sp. TaxID=1965333 RepID=UPI003BAEB922
NNGEVVGDYAYDGSHRRITREVDGETLHSYYNDAWRPVEERKDSETTASISYLWGARHRDDLVRRDRVVGGTTLNETRYVLMDYFNPAAITDEEGEVKERYAFSAFGLRTIMNPDFTVRSSSECGMEFGFQGQFIDAESGLINYGYRYYSPHLGRWTCKDPIEEKGGLNLYEFTENDPVNNVDKLGLVCGVVVARSKEFPGHQMIGGVGPANPNAKDLIPSRDYTSTSGNWAILNPEEGKWGTCSLPRKNDYSFYFYYLVAFKSDGCFASGVAKGLTCKDNLNCPNIKSCLDTYTAPGTRGTFEGTGTLGDNCRTASESALNACCVSMSDCVNCPVATGETTWPMYGN